MPDQTALGALGGIFNTVANDTLSYFNNIKDNQTRQQIASMDDQKAVTIAGINSSTITYIVVLAAIAFVGLAILRVFVK